MFTHVLDLAPKTPTDRNVPTKDYITCLQYYIKPGGLLDLWIALRDIK